MVRISFFLLAMITLVSCHVNFNDSIKGNGNIKTETRNVGSFHGVDGSNAVRIVFSVGEPSVKVETDENLQQYIKTEVKDGILHVYQEDNTSLQSTKSVTIFVSANTLDKIDISGASEFRMEGRVTMESGVEIEASGASKVTLDVKAPSINTSVEGASELKLAGETRDFNVEASGASSVQAYDLATENATADASGASSIKVFASVKLDADASGASDIRYKGNPALTSKDSGAGSVKKAD